MGERFELPESIPEGARNDTIYRYACSLQGQGRDDAEIARAVADANAARCAPPLSDAEVSAIVDNVTGRYDKGPSPEFAALARARSGSDSAARVHIIPTGVPAGDMGLSQAFAECYRERLRYEFGERAWYAYDAERGTWQRDAGEAARAMRDFIDGLRSAAQGMGKEEEREAALRRVAPYDRAHRRAELLGDAAALMEVRAGDFDRRPHLLNVRNGTIDLDAGRLRPHDPADMLTKVAGCEFDPRADGRAWASFLRDSFATYDGRADTLTAAFFQRMCGAALGCDTSRHRIYIACGPTRTGKSTALETIRDALGDYAYTLRPDALAASRRPDASGPTPDVAALEGARLVICPELEKGLLLNSAQVKQWTGNDTISARALHKGPTNFRATFALFIATNHLPDVNDPTLFEGGRAVPVPFVNRRAETERDRELPDRLRRPEGLSAVLNWLLAGWYLRNETREELPPRVRHMLAGYEADSDKVGQFIEDCCLVDRGARVVRAELYEAYKDWCDAGGRRCESSKGFYAEIERRGYRHTRADVNGKRAHVFKGLALGR